MELDQDLQARQQARALAKAAYDAQAVLAQMPQQKLDAIVKAVADAFLQAAPELTPPG